MDIVEGERKITIGFPDGTAITLDRPGAPAPGPADAPTQDDCASCGACCVEAGYVGVGDSDATPAELTQSTEGLRLSEKELRGVGPRCMKREPGGRCTALSGTVGVRVACGVYDQRPSVCRRFQPGSEGCLRARDVMRHAIAQGRKRAGYQEAAA